MDPIAVGRNIAKYRKANGLTQAILADRLGVSNKAISKWECGRGLPDKSMFPFIREVLNITDDQLFEGATLKADDAVSEKILRYLALVTCACIALVCLSGVVFFLTRGNDAATVSYYALTLKGAVFTDGTNVASVAADGDMPATEQDENKTFIGWADAENRFYTNESFAMPAADVVLSAVYEEDLGDFFTPSCSYEEILTGASYTATHVAIGPIKATKYEFTGGVSPTVGYKILNGYALRPDACVNTCPVAEDRGNILYMTFINNGAEDVYIKYSIDFYKTIGTVSVTVPAGGGVSVPLNYDRAPAGFSGELTCFHQLHFLKASAADVSLTVYGQLYDPDYYEQAQPCTVTFVGAAYNGADSVEMTYRAKLAPDALVHTEREKTFIGWKTGKGKAYVSDAELLQYYRVPLGGDTLTAVYAEDMTLFTPACVYKDASLDDSGKRTGVHNADGSTSYALKSDVASWLIYNGPDEQHEVANGCPIDTVKQRLYVLTVINDADFALTLELGPEYRGIKDPVTVEVPAHACTNAVLRVYGIDTPTSFWQINNLTAASLPQTDFGLTILGRYA